MQLSLIELGVPVGCQKLFAFQDFGDAGVALAVPRIPRMPRNAGVACFKMLHAALLKLFLDIPENIFRDGRE